MRSLHQNTTNHAEKHQADQENPYPPPPSETLYLTVSLLHVWGGCCHAAGLHSPIFVGSIDLGIAIVYLLLFRHARGS